MHAASDHSQASGVPATTLLFFSTSLIHFYVAWTKKHFLSCSIPAQPLSPMPSTSLPRRDINIAENLLLFTICHVNPAQINVRLTTPQPLQVGDQPLMSEALDSLKGLVSLTLIRDWQHLWAGLYCSHWLNVAPYWHRINQALCWWAWKHQGFIHKCFKKKRLMKLTSDEDKFCI